MADIFSTDEYEDLEEDNNKNEILPTSEVKVIIEEVDEPQNLLNNNSHVLACDESSSIVIEEISDDMTLKQDVQDSEWDDVKLSAEETLVNPDDLPPVEKLEKYATSDIAINRQVVARNLLETLRLVFVFENEDEVARIFNVLSGISEDYDHTVRTELMVQLPHIAAFCKDAKLYNPIDKHLMPILLNCIADENNQVRKTSHSALLSVVEQNIFDLESIKQKFCPMVVYLTDFKHPEDIRTESILLMSKLVVLLGKEIAVSKFLDSFFLLCVDRCNNVRKACASVFGDICTTVGTEVTEETLLPKFFVLCEDSAYCVRKACVENFMPVACVASREIRCKELSTLYLMLLSDQSRWVKLAAYQALGPFISTFADPDKTGLLYINDCILYDHAVSKSEVPNSPPGDGNTHKSDAPMCNGDIQLDSDICSSLEEFCKSDRTSSSDSCDSSVPPHSSTANCATDIPGIECHVGSYCTVIEVGSPPSSHKSNDCAANNTNCDVTTNGSQDKKSEEVLTNGVVSCKDGEPKQFQNHVNTVTVNGKNVCSSVPRPMTWDVMSGESSNYSVSEEKCHSQEQQLCESAFNHFQYWRSPLPDIDIEAELSSLSDTCPDNQEKRVFFRSSHNNQTLNKCYKLTFLDKAWRPNSQSDDEWEPHRTKTSALTAYDQDIVPPDLLLQYLRMIDAMWAQSIESEIARHCAYSLPAVALTLGRKYWPCLKDTFNALCSDLQGFIMTWKVRRTVASAMHRLARILGPDITSRDLLPVFGRFMCDLDEVRVGILQHLHAFLEVLGSQERMHFLPALKEFLVPSSEGDSNEKNWRFRLILAEQLVLIANLYEPQQVCEHLVPLALTLIKDKVCEVRLAAVRVLASVMRQMSLSPTPVYTKRVMSELVDKFVYSPKWLFRQLYVHTCHQLVVLNSLPPDQFAEQALPQLLYLCWDRIPNVRIAISRCLVTALWPIEAFSSRDSPHRELLLQTIHTLQSDTDADVRYFANQVPTHDCSCLYNGGDGSFPIEAEPFV